MTLDEACDKAIGAIALNHLKSIPQDVCDRYEHLGLAHIVATNLRYINAHGIGERELAKWQGIINDWAIYTKARAKVPLPGDRIILTATGSIQGTTRVYKNALIDGKHRTTGELSICTEPMTPWLYGVDSLAHVDVSGGYFGHLPAEALQFREIALGEFKFWGTRCQADGALHIQLPVHWWEVTTDKFY